MPYALIGRHSRAKWLVSALISLVILVLMPWILTAALGNAASIYLVRLLSDSGKQGRGELWTYVAHTLQTAGRFLPPSKRCSLAIGMWYGLGDLESAASMIATCEAALTETRYRSLRSGTIPLVVKSKAAQQTGDVCQALKLYQRAMVEEPHLLTSASYRYYYATIAEWAAKCARAKSSSAFWQYVAGKYNYRAHDLERAQRLLVSSIQKAQEIGDIQLEGLARYYLGLVLVQQGKEEEAANELLEASELEPRLGFACLQAQRLAPWSGRELECVQRVQAMPRTPLDHGMNDPDAEQTWQHWPRAITMLDYSDFDWGGATRVALWWDSDTPWCTGNVDGWYAAEGICIQVLDLENLAPNPGFEWGSLIDQEPLLGYTSDMYHNNLSNEVADAYRVVTSDATPYGQSHVGLLINRPELSRSSFVSKPIQIASSRRYLLTGWIDSEQGGNAALGCWWQGGQVNPSNRYVAQSVYSRPWQEYAGIMVPVAPSDVCQLWLLNYESEGMVKFDNILFALLPEIEP